MKKRFAVLYGSAVTGMFADGEVFPRDIDIMTNMDKVLIRTMAMRWFRRAYPDYPEDKEINIDFHDPEVKEGTVEVPMLQITGVSPKKEYHILYADDGVKVKAYIRENGVASLLRIYGNLPKVFAEKIREYPEKMSIMPEGIVYYKDRPEMDKYYSGLKATRNAWAHVKKENREVILQCLNCGRLFAKLMVEEPKTWSAPGFNNGWSRGIEINLSSNKGHYVIYNGLVELGEEDAIKLIYG